MVDQLDVSAVHAAVWLTAAVLTVCGGAMALSGQSFGCARQQPDGRHPCASGLSDVVTFDVRACTCSHCLHCGTVVAPLPQASLLLRPRYLDAGHNCLSGILPECIGSWTQLR